MPVNVQKIHRSASSKERSSTIRHAVVTDGRVQIGWSTVSQDCHLVKKYVAVSLHIGKDHIWTKITLFSSSSFFCLEKCCHIRTVYEHRDSVRPWQQRTKSVSWTMWITTEMDWSSRAKGFFKDWFSASDQTSQGFSSRDLKRKRKKRMTI